MQWFLERGFEERSVGALPESRRDIYNWERKSKIYMKVRELTRRRARGRERGNEERREGGREIRWCGQSKGRLGLADLKWPAFDGLLNFSFSLPLSFPPFAPISTKDIKTVRDLDAEELFYNV